MGKRGWKILMLAVLVFCAVGGMTVTLWLGYRRWWIEVPAGISVGLLAGYVRYQGLRSWVSEGTRKLMDQQRFLEGVTIPSALSLSGALALAFGVLFYVYSADADFQPWASSLVIPLIGLGFGLLLVSLVLVLIRRASNRVD